MNRRVALRVGLGAVGAVAGARLAAARTDGATAARRPDSPVASLAASPVAGDEVLYGAAGVVAVAGRRFRAEGFSMTGPAELVCVVARLASDGAASAAIPVVLEGYRRGLEGRFDAVNLDRADAARVDADEVVAQVGTLFDATGDATGLLLGLVAARTGDVLRFYASGTYMAHPLPFAVGLHGAIKDRTPSDDPVVVEDGYHDGGIWAMLPAVDDVPAGLAFAGDSDRTAP